MLHSTNLLDRTPIHQKVYIILLEILLENLLILSVIWKYGQWPHLLKVSYEIIGYNFKIYYKFKNLTLVLMSRFIHYISVLWIVWYIKCKKVTICIQLTSIICFMCILLGDMLLCLINVINSFHCLWYIHTARQMEIQPPKIKSNLSAKRSTLKPCNSKTSPMTLDFLYDFLTLLQSRN
jgi:hypothetical protein